jgi:plasmid stabilization system protein ParE
MKYFQVITSPKAQSDITDLKQFIKNELKVPETASNYIKGLNATIQKLSYLADIRKGFNPYVQSMFGENAHHVIYKKMTIIYYIENDCVYVDRVIATSLIH